MQQALHDKGYSQQRPGWKPLLDPSSKAQYVAILKQYHPDRFNWHEVIFADEILAKIGDQVGQFRAWAKTDERYRSDVKHDRAKRQSEGMVWACFIYGSKRPIKFWYTEEEEEKETAKSALQEENEVLKTALVLERNSRLKGNKKGKLLERGRK
jgi:hypothetical protein